MYFFHEDEISHNASISSDSFRSRTKEGNRGFSFLYGISNWVLSFWGLFFSSHSSLHPSPPPHAAYTAFEKKHSPTGQEKSSTVKYMPSMCGALDSISSSEKEERERKEEGEKGDKEGQSRLFSLHCWTIPSNLKRSLTQATLFLSRHKTKRLKM